MGNSGPLPHLVGPWGEYLGAGHVPGHGRHNGLCPTCMDNGIFHIVVACDGPQGAQDLLHQVLHGRRRRGHPGAAPQVALHQVLTAWLLGCGR